MANPTKNTKKNSEIRACVKSARQISASEPMKGPLYEWFRTLHSKAFGQIARRSGALRAFPLRVNGLKILLFGGVKVYFCDMFLCKI
jgi:hypothetical protein